MFGKCNKAHILCHHYYALCFAHPTAATELTSAVDDVSLHQQSETERVQQETKAPQSRIELKLALMLNQLQITEMETRKVCLRDKGLQVGPGSFGCSPVHKPPSSVLLSKPQVWACVWPAKRN